MLRSLTSLRLAPRLSTGLARHSFYTYANEPAHPIPGRKPQFVSAEQALSVVKSSRVHLSCISTPHSTFTVIEILVNHSLTFSSAHTTHTTLR